MIFVTIISNLLLKYFYRHNQSYVPMFSFLVKVENLRLFIHYSWKEKTLRKIL